MLTKKGREESKRERERVTQKESRGGRERELQRETRERV